MLTITPVFQAVRFVLQIQKQMVLLEHLCRHCVWLGLEIFEVEELSRAGAHNIEAAE
jgi:hypothetical protein